MLKEHRLDSLNSFKAKCSDSCILSGIFCPLNFVTQTVCIIFWKSSQAIKVLMCSTFLISSTKSLFHLLQVPLLSLISDLLPTYFLPWQGKRRAERLSRISIVHGAVIQFRIFGVFISLAEICLKELVPCRALWRSLIWTDCVTSASSHASWLAQLQGSVFQLFLWCAFWCFSPQQGECPYTHLGKPLWILKQQIPYEEPSNPSDSWTWTESFYGCYPFLHPPKEAVSFKDTIPCCLREEVCLASVQIPKSWFFFGLQTEGFKAALDFSSISCVINLCVLVWFVPLSDRNSLGRFNKTLYIH